MCEHVTIGTVRMISTFNLTSDSFTRTKSVYRLKKYKLNIFSHFYEGEKCTIVRTML